MYNRFNRVLKEDINKNYDIYLFYYAHLHESCTVGES